MSILTNASGYLSTFGATPNGVFEGWHPSVIDFQTQHGMASWAGSRFWGAFTTDWPENPYLIKSSNAPSATQSWTAVMQLDNQANYDDELDPPAYTAFAADVKIVYDPVGNQLVLYWVREGTANGGRGLVRATLSSSMVLSTPVMVISDNVVAYLSPAVIRKAADNWPMWACNDQGQIVYFPSATGTDYSIATDQACTANVIQDAYGGLIPWHIDAMPHPTITDRVELVVTAYPADSLGSYQGYCVVHAVTSFSNPTVITTPKAPAHLVDPAQTRDYWTTSGYSPLPPEWDAWGVHKAAHVLEHIGGEIKLHLWYTGFTYGDWMPNGDPRAKIGYTSGTLYTAGELTPPPFDPPQGRYQTAIDVALTDPAGGTIYYTTNGSMPTEASTPYTVPVVIPFSTDAVTLKFVAYAGGVAGEVQTAVYEFYTDATAPIPAFTATASFTAPTVSAQRFASVAIPSMSATATFTAPVVTATVAASASVPVPAFTVTASFSAPVVTAQQQAVVSVPSFAATATFSPPTVSAVSGMVSATVAVPQFSATAVFIVPTVQANTVSSGSIRGPDGTPLDLRDIYGNALQLMPAT
jgi:hypothetical protein